MGDERRELIVSTPAGLYCPPGDFHIDPWRPVARAVLTHAHADHARPGSQHYLAQQDALPILRTRLGAEASLQGLAYGERIEINGVRVSLHPAGHVLGSAQVRVEHQGQVWVASGDYKLQADPTCTPFEPLRCDCFITESTFGLPIYRWDEPAAVMAQLNRWWAANADEGRVSVVYAYAFGKAQRLLMGLDPSIGPVHCHGAVEVLNAGYEAAGLPLPARTPVPDARKKEPALRRALVIAPPSAAGTPWLQRFGAHRDAFASGWMQVRGARRRRGVDLGLVLSDHADWPGLLDAIRGTQAERVIVTHGAAAPLIRHLQEQGIDAGRFATEYGEEEQGVKRFAALYAELDASTSSARKHAALLAYLRDTDATNAAEDAAWGLWFLAGGKPRQLVPTAVLRAALLQRTGLAEWLFDECYAQVGDLAETISLLLPPPSSDEALGLNDWMHAQLLPLRGLPPAEQTARLHAQWDGLPREERLLHGKLITGGFRVGVSRQGVINALAEHAGLDAKSLAQRFVGFTNQLPTAEGFAALTAAGEREEPGRPYPFFLAHPLEDLAQLGDAADWIAEWKWDGIRAQWIRRAGQVFVWSRGEELISERFPELLALPLPEGTVLDGELVIWKDGRVQPFQTLQQRIQRKALSPKLLREAPAALIAYDLLERGGEDQRALPQHERRARLEALLVAHPHPALHLSEPVEGDWPQRAAARAQARTHGAEGLMLKHRASAYGVGRSKAEGQWLKWKLDPYTVDAVLLYAQKGHGRRANLYSDYSFGVWNADRTQLLPFAKAYSGLSDAEMAQVDARIRATTVESFGPVRSVKPTLVVELGFEGIAASPRHKSGIAVRFPRMLRLRWDKPVEEADTLDTLKALLP